MIKDKTFVLNINEKYMGSGNYFIRYLILEGANFPSISKNLIYIYLKHCLKFKSTVMT